MVDVTTKTPAELKNLLANYAKVGRSSDILCLEVQAELARRGHCGLSFEKSISLIRDAGFADRYISYKLISEQSGLTFAKVRYKLFAHLGDLLVYAHHKGWPLITAIVVSEDQILTGTLTEQAQAGFTKAARDLGYQIGLDEAAFLKAEQSKVFRWAKGST